MNHTPDYGPRPQRWTLSPHYAGPTYPGHYSAGVGQSRDSDALERANFDAMAELLGARPFDDPDDPEVQDGTAPAAFIVRESHWAVGWIEWIAIAPDHVGDFGTFRTLLRAARACAGLRDYPALDEDRWSEYESEECAQVWKDCYNEAERAKYLREHGPYGRHAGKWRPGYTLTREAVRGDWHAAANILPCPSDLIG